MAFMLGKHIVFIDSMQFMASSLDILTKNLPEEAFKYAQQVFKDNKLALKRQKGVYPDDYMDSFEKFNDPILPTKQDFYSMLTNTGITDEQYQHPQEVWSTFRPQNMGQYHDLYLKSDVLLLADVFENFRKTCLENIELDPVHYFTTPGLSWDVVLKMTGIKLELINDIDQYQFIKKGMHGGTSYIAHRYGEANNKHMSTYDAEKNSKYLMHLDANNLYGWAMMQYLPYGGFRWLTENQIKKNSKKKIIYQRIIKKDMY